MVTLPRSPKFGGWKSIQWWNMRIPATIHRHVSEQHRHVRIWVGDFWVHVRVGTSETTRTNMKFLSYFSYLVKSNFNPDPQIWVAYGIGIWFSRWFHLLLLCFALIRVKRDHLCFFPADAAGKGNGQLTGLARRASSREFEILCAGPRFLKKLGFVPPTHDILAWYFHVQTRDSLLSSRWHKLRI